MASPGTLCRSNLAILLTHQEPVMQQLSLVIAAGHIFEMLEDIRSDPDAVMDADFDAVLIKTLLVHSASSGDK